jgi:tRNA1(Val) A37 N6-methylase TrmN6
LVFEPSAGNGLLTIAAHPQKVIVNEIDQNRRLNLLRDGYQEVLKRDASNPFNDMHHHFDAVLTNPPFGRIGRSEKLYVNGYRIYDLDHHMALIALDTMRDSGKAAIIIGGHLTFDQRGRITAGKDRIFFNYLYSKYHVEDVIPINGKKLYAKQGTAFNVTLILINGRKNNQSDVAPLFNPLRDQPVNTFDELYQRVMKHLNIVPSSEQLRKKAQALLVKLQGGTLEGPYHPSSKARSLETNVPDSMDFELHKALKHITEDVGGDMDNFVRHRLGYRTKQQLYDSLGAEQIDAVGMAIYNIEALNQGIIIGDQTGIGKGRTAAAMIRYAHVQELKPIFLTVGVNLFSDIYRDLEAIGSQHLVPFIVNARESKTDVKDQDGLVLYQAPTSIEQAKVFENKDLTGYDFVMATYSQFNSADKKPLKPNFLKEVAKDTIIIMDESHIASGTSNTGQLMQQVVRSTKGAVFLSATFAKRPNNMPIYAVKTAISETNMSKEALISAIERGGVALQEILSSQLVSEGQMLRRERTYEGIEVNYISLDNKAQEHSAIADNITTIIRDIIRFQNLYVDNRVSELDEMMAGDGSEATKRKGTEQGGVDNQPYFSKVFNVINQMLFAIKAEDVADRAIMRLKEGKKPIIAFSSTMGSFLEQLEDDDGAKAVLGDTINADFAIVLEKGLEGVLRYTVTEPNGQKTHMTFNPADLGMMALDEYNRIRHEIRTISSGITVSPIDVIIQKIETAGFKVGEVTGRKLRLNLKGNKGTIENRKRYNTNDVFRRFNNNELDVLLINQSGSTGASAHAVPTSKVPENKVKQRVMIVLQPELDINIEIQKRGRINRTGQIFKPIYDYINSAIPAEKRLMMMLQKKLKSLDANTSSNQKQSSKILSVQDFLNKYGDLIVVGYLTENPQLNELLGDPVHVSVSKKTAAEHSNVAAQSEDAAAKVSGRVAVLSTRMQEEFYNEISERYENLIDYLKQTGDYDLEVEEMDLKAKTVTTKILKMGKGGNTAFGEDSILETIEANVLKKPFKADELKSIILQTLEGKTPQSYQQDLIRALDEHTHQMLEDVRNKLAQEYDHHRKNVENEAKLKKIKRESPQLYNDALIDRLAELSDQQAQKLNNDTAQIKKRISQVRDFFSYFTVGKQLIYLETYGNETVNNMAVFLGFKVEPKRKNPYAPSAIALRFAIASSQKSIEIPASYGVLLNAIRGASLSIADKGLDHVLYEWGDAIYTNNKDRQIRYVVTGNILQAFASAKGKLISFTTIEGETRKGILLPESFDLDKTLEDGISIPISKTINLFKSLVKGKQITCSHAITFFKDHDNMFRMIVSGSMREGGEVFLNLKVIALTFNENFEKIGTNMTAYVELSDLAEMLNVLEDDIGVSVKMTEQQINNMGLVNRPVKKRIKIEAPPMEEQRPSFDEKPDDRVRLLRLRAKALEIELKLLGRKNRAS